MTIELRQEVPGLCTRSPAFRLRTLRPDRRLWKCQPLTGNAPLYELQVRIDGEVATLAIDDFAMGSAKASGFSKSSLVIRQFVIVTPAKAGVTECLNCSDEDTAFGRSLVGWGVFLTPRAEGPLPRPAQATRFQAISKPAACWTVMPCLTPRRRAAALAAATLPANQRAWPSP